MEFDVVFIGGGPGGYVGAIKAAQLGLKTACVEMRPKLGGTCLNVGCIPSKALLTSSHKYHELKGNLTEHGITCESPKIDIAKMMARKSNIIESLDKGIKMLFAKNKVVHFEGVASFIDSNTILVKGQEDLKVSAKNFVIATGSSVVEIPGIEIDEKFIVSSTGALELTKVPGRMLVIGGGYIGLEMASVWSRLGAEVTVAEFADRILPNMDADISKEAQKILSKQGIKFMTSTKVVSAKVSGVQVDVAFEGVDGNGKAHDKYDVVLVSIGRKANTAGLSVENAGLELDKYGKIPVDENLKSKVSGIFAIGDVTYGPMLAHKAEEDGIFVAELLAGQKPHLNYNAVPGIVYTYPEIASVGKSEDQLKKEGIEYQVSKFPFLANSRARTNSETEGFVKIITTKGDTKILGASIIGANAGELIQELVFAIEFGAAGEDIARISHGHPGLSEAVREASFLAAYGKAIHI
jgi:dihydrolipoamide dehydrogenase